MTSILEQLADWQPFTAIVVGDFMLDRLVHGNVDRISPEAPVPVMHAIRSEDRAGGAGNVCLNLAALGGTVHALGVTGNDQDGDALRSLLDEGEIDARGLVIDETRPTTVKQSLVGLAQHRHPQKMFRIDYESRAPISDEIGERLLAMLSDLTKHAHVVCLEDYNKGVCTPAFCKAVIDLCKKRDIEVIVDPASLDDYSKYAGASAITPNRNEAAKAIGNQAIEDEEPRSFAEVGRRMVDELDLAAAVITLDRHGAMLAVSGQEPELVPTVARSVYDVTGAGDMVLASLAAGRANGFNWPDSVRIANIAAGLEIEQFGVVSIPFEQIHHAFVDENRGSIGKIRGLRELAVEVRALKRQGRKICFTNGCFDILHAGHLSLLHRASEFGDFLIVGINSDDSVRRQNKGPDRPINNERDRVEMLAGLSCVDAVLVFDEDTPERVIEELVPDILVKGAEYSVDQVPGASFVVEQGGRVELLDMVAGRSTTNIVKRIRSSV